MLEAVSHYVGYNISQGMNALWLYDILIVEKIHNLTFPEWADTYWKELEEIEAITFHYILNSPVSLRLRIGPLFQKIIENMMKKINGETPDMKVQIYSAHDVNVGGVLMALNFTDMPRPPYCATILFELHEMVDATMTVRLLYLNSTDPLKDIGKPHVLVLDDCSEFCPIENFIKKIQHWIPDNWEQECQLDTSDGCETDKTCENVHPDVRPVHKTDEL
ncbi:Prostatic acid phosphatase [Araneus ventricosus]|uniref:acid phosphatase n=1 Tax=Araneus ventricosus TaxID=182803 RepID=A0A4Y2STM2_ARAVE|nr:Prostatic acid phosphatase [Araneus ventricosus]